MISVSTTMGISPVNVFTSDNTVSLRTNMKAEEAFFGLLTDHGTPRQVYVLKGNDIELRDSHSGLDISTATTVANGISTIDALVRL